MERLHANMSIKARKIRVLFVVSSLGCGGAEAVIRLLVQSLASPDIGPDNLQLAVLTIEPAALDFHTLPAGVERSCVRRIGEPFQGGSLSYNFRLLRKLRIDIQALRPTVIVSFGDTLNARVLLSTIGLGIPVIVSERNDPRRQRIPIVWQILRRLLYPYAALLVVQTQSMSHWAGQWIENQKIQTIPNPIEPSLSSPIAVEERAKFILAVGSLHHRKGHDLLIEAFARIHDFLPDWTLTIAGEGPARANLTNQIAKLDLSKKITLIGRINQPRDLYRTCGMFVLSSRYEGFPNVLCEAMAESAPVVSFNCLSGPGEIVSHEIDGLLVRPEDVTQLAETLQRLAHDLALRERLSIAASRAVEGLHPKIVSKEWAKAISTASA